MELEDTVRLLTAIAGSLADLVGSVHEVNKAHTRLLAGGAVPAGGCKRRQRAAVGEL